jgi:hypothetical protein
MIKYGQKIKIIDTSTSSRWRIRPLSMPVEVYKYYKKEDSQYNPPGILYSSQQDDLESGTISRTYFRTNKDGNDPNPMSKRMAAYVVNISELGLRDLAVFLFPLTAYIAIKKDPGVTGETDWIIEKIGFGLETKYACSKTERTDLTEEEKIIVSSLMNDNPIFQVLSQKVRIYTEKDYTHFDRFDILDMDD